MMDLINKKIKELFESTPPSVGVGYGMKVIGGQMTEEECIIFTVEKKLPLSDIPESEIIPSEINIEGKNYRTDVMEVGKITPIAYPFGPFCNTNVPNIENNCYNWWSVPPSNRQTQRPLRGGVSVSSYNNPNSVGTLGFLALDIETDGLVGVSNTHVFIRDQAYTSERNLNGQINNETSDFVYQTAEFGPQSNLIIGQVVRYVPLLKATGPSGNIQYNQVDGALTSISQDVIDNQSYRILGLSGTTPMPFASTAEIDALYLGNMTLASSGRSSGVKQGPNCGLMPYAYNFYLPVGCYYSQGVCFTANFNNLLCFTRLSSSCAWPIIQGDSGSVLIAQIGGVDKIIGLIFALAQSSFMFGVAARIDQVAAQLGIKPWLGGTPKIINPSTIKLVTQGGGSSQKTITCNSKTLWQVGLTNQSYSC